MNGRGGWWYINFDRDSKTFLDKSGVHLWEMVNRIKKMKYLQLFLDRNLGQTKFIQHTQIVQTQMEYCRFLLLFFFIIIFRGDCFVLTRWHQTGWRQTIFFLFVLLFLLLYFFFGLVCWLRRRQKDADQIRFYRIFHYYVCDSLVSKSCIYEYRVNTEICNELHNFTLIDPGRVSYQNT